MPTLDTLQNSIKRNPEAHRDDFFQQYEHFKSLIDLVRQNPNVRKEALFELLSFMGATCHYYTKVKKKGVEFEITGCNFSNDVLNILEMEFHGLDNELRLALTKTVILLRTHDQLAPIQVHKIFLRMLTNEDKRLRTLISSFIYNDIKRLHKSRVSKHIKTHLQDLLFASLKSSNVKVARMALLTLIKCYQTHIWQTDRIVNMIAYGALRNDTQLVVPSLDFFLDDAVHDYDDEAEESMVENMKTAAEFVKMNKNRGGMLNKSKHLREVQRQKSKLKRLQRQLEGGVKVGGSNFLAMQQIINPGKFCDNLLKNFHSGGFKFHVKLRILNLVSRIIYLEQIPIPKFYSIAQRYIIPSNPEITKILTFIIQSIIDSTPENIAEELVYAVRDKFVLESNEPEQIVLGLNTIRGICARCPTAIDASILEDLCLFVRFKQSRPVANAAKGIINLYREVNPDLLTPKFRGNARKIEDDDELFSGGFIGKDFITDDEAIREQEELEEELANEEYSTRSHIPPGLVANDVKRDPLVPIIDDVDEEEEDEEMEDQEEYEEEEDDDDENEMEDDEDVEDVEEAEVEEEEEEMEDNDDEIQVQSDDEGLFLNPDALLDGFKKKQSKEERIAHMRAGRGEKQLYGLAKKKSLRSTAVSTNKEKSRGKNIQMLRHSRRFKKIRKMSLREKQLAKFAKRKKY
eukprot:TRINITY_DN3101_c1_g9_i1.p1 TRINITY_DN3101_c1_g9~~TRINITY_DN3101_c1_g9_i1.p1  ORF type:complete len:688 (+),score=196.78 TRINITY_DN3101_c1_g9_i1:37-2100(+)